MQGVLSMLPGVGKVKDQLAAAGLDDGMLTAPENDHPVDDQEGAGQTDILNGSRRKRIAGGAGVEVVRSQQASQDAPPDGGHDEASVGYLGGDSVLSEVGGMAGNCAAGFHDVSDSEIMNLATNGEEVSRYGFVSDQTSRAAGGAPIKRPVITLIPVGIEDVAIRSRESAASRKDRLLQSDIAPIMRNRLKLVSTRQSLDREGAVARIACTGSSRMQVVVKR